MSHHVVIKYDKKELKQLVKNIKKMRLNKDGRKINKKKS
jgi:hypothetical protein